MDAEGLIAQAEQAAYSEDYRNFSVGLDTETFLAIHNLLKIEKIMEETQGHDRQLARGEGFGTMLADRFRDACRKTDGASVSVEVDINYRELNSIGDIAIVKDNAAMAPYVLNLIDAFIAAGGRDNTRLRFYFEMLNGK